MNLGERRVECPDCGLTYNFDELNQLDAAPVLQKKFWRSFKCPCGHAFLTEQWLLHPLEEVERAYETQLKVTVEELMEGVGLYYVYLNREYCNDCPTFPAAKPEGAGMHVEQEKGRVADIKKSCSYSLTLTQLFITIIKEIIAIFGSDKKPQAYPELIAIFKDFVEKLEAFKVSKHQDGNMK